MVQNGHPVAGFKMKHKNSIFLKHFSIRISRVIMMESVSKNGLCEGALCNFFLNIYFSLLDIKAQLLTFLCECNLTQDSNTTNTLNHALDVIIITSACSCTGDIESHHKQK